MQGDDVLVYRWFERARETPVGGRPRILRAAPSAVRDEVRSLLDALELDPSFLELDPLAPAPTSDEPDGTLVPEWIGPYRILGLLGRGGMGVVYLAREESPPRDVALKVLRPELLTETARRRFEHEVEILGRLEHPGIARIYAAGTADVGDRTALRYFAMERVEGRSCTEFAMERRLDRRARVGLLVRIVDAVQFAHRNGIIHRDLKPANILVDRFGQPKVLDFGVARLVEPDVVGADVSEARTVTGAMIGTIGYMSPEQCRGRHADIRADVFALGVIAFELVLGRRLCDDEPGSYLDRVLAPGPLPSMRAADRTIDRDLDAIVARAIEKDPDQRYPAAVDFADELRAWLDGRPPRARPSGAAGACLRWVRRHPVKAAAAFVAVLALLGTARGLRTWREFVALREANAAADRQSRLDRSTIDTMKDLSFEDASPADVIRRFERILDEDPRRADVVGGLVFTLLSEQRDDEARTVIDRYGSIAEPAETLRDIETVAGRILGWEIPVGRSEPRSAMALLLEALWLVREVDDVDRADIDLAFRKVRSAALRADPPWPYLFDHLARTAAVRHSVRRDRESLNDFSDAVETFVGRSTESDRIAYWQARLALAEDRLADAIIHIDRALEIDPLRPSYLSRRGLILSGMKRHHEAIDAYSRAIEQSATTAAYYYNRGNAWEQVDRRREAGRDYEIATLLNPRFGSAWLNLSAICSRLRSVADAVCAGEAAVAISPNSRRAWFNLGTGYELSGRYHDAIRCFRRALVGGGADPETYAVRTQLAFVLLKVRGLDEAQEQYALAWQEEQLDPMARGMVALFVARGNYAEALAWSQQLEIARNDHQAAGARAALAIRARCGDAADLDLRLGKRFGSPNPDALSKSAQLLASMGREELSAFIYRMVLEIDPCHPAAVEWLTRARAIAGT